MRTYYRPPVQHSGRKRLVAVSVLVVLLLVVDWLSGGLIRAGVRMAGTSASRSLAAVGTSIEATGLLSSKASLEATNHTLATQVATLTEQVATVAYLRHENEQLRALLGLSEHTPGFVAPVVSSPTASPYGTFTIGVGSGSGNKVSRGDIALTQGGFVVGRVSDVGGGTAVVTELLAPGASLEVQLDGASAIISGEGGGNGRADVPRGLAVSIGDVATSPQLGGRPVAVVGDVASSSASAAQTVYLRLPRNLSGLQFVYVASTGN